jgi:hypothetical protein
VELSEIQKQLKAPKSQRNTFGNYNYRNCEDILEAVKPLLGEATLVISDEVVQLGDRYYIKATARFTSGDKVTEAYGWAREPLARKGMDDSQITGATSSYARKYALNGLFCIDDTKDADNDPPKQPASKPPVKTEQMPKASVPPAYTRLKHLLTDIGVKEGDAALASAVVEHCTKGTKGGTVTLAAAHKTPAVCERAIVSIQEIRSNTSGAAILETVGEWIKGGKK